MSFCTKCGRQRTGAQLFCTGCGTPLRDRAGQAAPPSTDQAAPPSTAASGLSSAATVTAAPAAPVRPAAAEQRQPEAAPAYLARADVPSFDVPRARVRPSGKWRWAVIVSVAVLAVGGGTAGWVLTHRHVTSIKLQNRAASNGSGSRSASSSPTPSASQPSSTPAPASPTQSPAANTTPNSAGGLVALAPTVVQNALVARVEAFINRYFAAINAHSYARYDALLEPVLAQNETPQSFHSGYRSTTDSAATINSIYATGPGQVAVALTFVSHQLPEDSASGTACTDWNITLYLQNYSGQYLMGPAPPGYHAQSNAC